MHERMEKGVTNLAESFMSDKASKHARPGLSVRPQPKAIRIGLKKEQVILKVIDSSY